MNSGTGGMTPQQKAMVELNQKLKAVGKEFGAVITWAVLTPEQQRSNNVDQAIEQCESELPRHLSCEPVYGARVVEEKK